MNTTYFTMIHNHKSIKSGKWKWIERCKMSERKRNKSTRDRWWSRVPHETDRDIHTFIHLETLARLTFSLFIICTLIHSTVHTENHGNSVIFSFDCVSREWAKRTNARTAHTQNTEQVYYYGFVTTATIVIDGNVLSGWISPLSFYLYSFILSSLLPRKSRALALILDS